MPNLGPAISTPKSHPAAAANRSPKKGTIMRNLGFANSIGPIFDGRQSVATVSFLDQSRAKLGVWNRDMLELQPHEGRQHRQVRFKPNRELPPAVEGIEQPHSGPN